MTAKEARLRLIEEKINEQQACLDMIPRNGSDEWTNTRKNILIRIIDLNIDKSIIKRG